MGALASFWERADKGQLLKWTVYSLLLLNWAYYAVEEYYIASHTLRHGGTWLQWLEEFATTIDEFAWFGLLFMFELETYVLEDDAFEHWWVKWGVHGLRLACYIMLVHTVFARVTSFDGTWEVQPDPQITSLCQVTEQDISFGENYRYEIITPENCSELSQDSVFYLLEPSVITDQDGLWLEKAHTLVDLSDSITWLLVIWAIELAVWLQNRNITGGWLMAASHSARVFYALLACHAAFWAWAGHWVYAWDQFLWIAGFWAIENNLSEWRKEIRMEDDSAGGAIAEGDPG